MATIEEQAEELRKHREELEHTGLGVFFSLTYGSLISPFQKAMRAAVKNKDGTDANLGWEYNIPIVYQGFDRACGMHRYDEKVSVKSFATDWYELTREGYRSIGLSLGYDKEAEDLFAWFAEQWLGTTGWKIPDRKEEEDNDETEA